jgi:hypothetical protein
MRCKPYHIAFFVMLASILFTMPSCHPKAQEKSTIHMSQSDSLQNINLQDYVGKPVGALLAALPPYDEFFFTDNGRPAILGGANFRFGERWLQIETDEIVHQNRYEEKYRFDLELFKKELISRVELSE